MMEFIKLPINSIIKFPLFNSLNQLMSFLANKIMHAFSYAIKRMLNEINSHGMFYAYNHHHIMFFVYLNYVVPNSPFRVFLSTKYRIRLCECIYMNGRKFEGKEEYERNNET